MNVQVALLFVLIPGIILINAGNTYSNCRPARTSDSVDCTHFDENALYRTYDGTCNNLKKKNQGATNTPMVRFLKAQYAHASDIPRGFPGYENGLPSANDVSRAVFEVVTKNKGNSEGLSVLFMSFGQFLDHDMTLTPHASCRPTNCASSDAFTYPCFPIKFRDNAARCTLFARSVPVCPKGSEQQGTREQLNDLSSYLDLSMVYGSSKSQSEKLRKLDGSGEMKVTSGDLLPIAALFNGRNCQNPAGCSLVGDVRGDENIGLYAMHTLWVRHHNSISKKIRVTNPHWNEETIYQTARQINGAVFQHIVYTEWLPFLVNLHRYKGYYHADASIGNSFSTAAFRFGHSLVPNSWSMLDKNFDPVQKPIPLQKTFFNTQQIRKFGVEPTVFGLIGNKSQNVDNEFAEGVIRKLFVPFGKPGYMDLTALNIQRGRDHGIATFTKWRRACGLGRIKSFDDLDGIMPYSVIRNFRQIYKSVHDIDLFAGGIVEFSSRGKVIGDTFHCIQRHQFQKLRDGDRYYYEKPGVFTKEQLSEIKQMTMSKVLCNTLKGIVSIQTGAFKAYHSSMGRKTCQMLGEMNFSAWEDW